MAEAVRFQLFQALGARRSEFVKLGAPVVVRHAPLGRQQVLALQPVQRRVESPLLDGEGVARNLADPQQNAVPVLRPE
jgi:hypothetical protein